VIEPTPIVVLTTILTRDPDDIGRLVDAHEAGRGVYVEAL